MRARRSLLALLAIVAGSVALLAGCGGSSGGVVGEEASYFPKTAPYVALIATDPKGAAIRNAQALLDKFPEARPLLGSLKSSIQAAGLDYRRDIKPVLGNAYAVGATGLDAAGNTTGTLAVAVTPDAGALDRLIAKEVAHGRFHPAGEADGAKLYTRGSSSAYAVKDQTLLFAHSLGAVKAALSRKGQGTLTGDDLDHALTGLPGDALVRVDVNLPALLGRPSAAQARRVPWIAALGPLGVAVSANGSGLKVSYRVDTSSRKLAAADVPLATGDQTPQLRGAGPLVLGIRDLRHVAMFGLRAAQAADPQAGSTIETARAFLRARYGVDLDRDVLDQLPGPASVSTDLRSYTLVADLADASAMTRTLSKLAPFVRMALSGTPLAGAQVRRSGPAQWTIRRGGRVLASYGVDDGKLLAGNASFATLRRAASGSPPTPSGAKGSVVLALTPSAIADLARRAGAPPSVLAPLERLAGGGAWASSTPQATQGELRLDVR